MELWKEARWAGRDDLDSPGGHDSHRASRLEESARRALSPSGHACTRPQSASSLHCYSTYCFFYSSSSPPPLASLSAANSTQTPDEIFCSHPSLSEPVLLV